MRTDKKSGQKPTDTESPIFLILNIVRRKDSVNPFFAAKIARPPEEIPEKTRAANIVERRAKISDNMAHEKNIVLRNRGHRHRASGFCGRESASPPAAELRLDASDAKKMQDSFMKMLSSLDGATQQKFAAAMATIGVYYMQDVRGAEMRKWERP